MALWGDEQKGQGYKRLGLKRGFLAPKNGGFRGFFGGCPAGVQRIFGSGSVSWAQGAWNYGKFRISRPQKLNPPSSFGRRTGKLFVTPLALGNREGQAPLQASPFPPFPPFPETLRYVVTSGVAGQYVAAWRVARQRGMMWSSALRE
jgi:hypothetical protein